MDPAAKQGGSVCAHKRSRAFYCTGGKCKEKESDEQALAREVQEETGVTLIPETIKHLSTFEGPAHGAGEGARMTMRCYNADYKGTIEPKNEIEELAWFTSADMSRTTEMGRTILTWFKEQNLIN